MHVNSSSASYTNSIYFFAWEYFILLGQFRVEAIEQIEMVKIFNIL